MLNSPQEFTGLLSQLKEQTLQTPGDLKLLLRLARLYMKSSNYSEAEKVFRKLLKNDPENADTLVEFTNCLIKSGNFEDAELELERALAIKPGMVQAFLTGACLYEQTGNTTKQISYMMLAANAVPEKYEIRLALAEQLRKYGDLHGAIAQYDLILAHDPNQETANFSKGSILMKLDMLTEAIQYFNVILNNNPSAFDAHFNLGSCFFRQNKFAAAISHFRISCRDANLANRSHYLMAQCYFKRNDIDNAIVAMEKLVEADSQNVSYRKCLGGYYEATQEYDMACEVYQELTAIAPNRAEFWLKLASTQIKLKLFDRAQKTLNRIFKVHPGHIEGHRVLADLYAAKRQYKEAIEEYQRLLMLNENDGAAYIGLANIYNKLGRENEEMAALSKAVEYSSEPLNVLMRLGELERKYNLPTSLEHFKRIKELAPDSDFAKEADYYIRHTAA